MKRMLPLVTAIIGIVLALAGCASSGGAAPAATEPAAPIEHKGIVYATPDGVELRLDLVAPGEGKGPYPAIVFIFGGGFNLGTRDQWSIILPAAARRGYVAVTIDHRMTNAQVDGKAKYPFPAQVHDVKCAVRWLRSNAAKYGIDAAHIGAAGFSSGGILALLLGLTEPSDGLEGTCGDPSISSSVQAVVTFAGITDLVTNFDALYPGTSFRWLGGTLDTVPDLYKAASPVTHVGGKDSPVMNIYGDGDAALPQGRLLGERMKQAGGDHTLIVVEGKGHELLLVNFFQDNPMWSFFDKHLKVGR